MRGTKPCAVVEEEEEEEKEALSTEWLVREIYILHNQVRLHTSTISKLQLRKERKSRLIISFCLVDLLYYVASSCFRNLHL